MAGRERERERRKEKVKEEKKRLRHRKTVTYLQTNVKVEGRYCPFHFFFVPAVFHHFHQIPLLVQTRKLILLQSTLEETEQTAF